MFALPVFNPVRKVYDTRQTVNNYPSGICWTRIDQVRLKILLAVTKNNEAKRIQRRASFKIQRFRTMFLVAEISVRVQCIFLAFEINRSLYQYH